MLLGHHLEILCRCDRGENRRPSAVEAAGKEKAPEASTKSQLARWFCLTARGCGYPVVIARKSSREYFQGDVPRQTCLAYW
jgi:hypothetical protein